MKGMSKWLENEISNGYICFVFNLPYFLHYHVVLKLLLLDLTIPNKGLIKKKKRLVGLDFYLTTYTYVLYKISEHVAVACLNMFGFCSHLKQLFQMGITVSVG